MAPNQPPVKSAPANLAHLANVAVCLEALGEAMRRPHHLPGLVVLYGPSGWGKSSAATIASLECDAYYVACQSSWNKGALVKAIAKEMGIMPAKNVADITAQVSEQLALSGRPLIIDEMDYLVNKQAVEIVKDIYESSMAAIMLIGEEGLPHKLTRWEHFHNRILKWAPAQPADEVDTRALTELYCRDVEVADDLLNAITASAKGSIRRIVVNLERARTKALRLGTESIDLATWGDEPFYTSQPPARRVQ